MEEKQISRAGSVSDLDGYHIEAIDIIMALGVFRRFVVPEKTVSDILNQAFELSLKPKELTLFSFPADLVRNRGA